jgi:hypothetical protein
MSKIKIFKAREHFTGFTMNAPYSAEVINHNGEDALFFGSCDNGHSYLWSYMPYKHFEELPATTEELDLFQIFESQLEKDSL